MASIDIIMHIHACTQSHYVSVSSKSNYKKDLIFVQKNIADNYKGYEVLVRRKNLVVSECWLSGHHHVLHFCSAFICIQIMCKTERY